VTVIVGFVLTTNVTGTTSATNTNASNSLTTTNFYNGNIVINDNFIAATQLNSNLNLSANGTGFIDINDSLFADQNFTVGGSSSLKDTNVFGLLTAGSINLTGRFVVDDFQTGDILINDNFITTTVSNADLELKGNSGGIVVALNNTEILGNVTIGGSVNLHNTVINGNLDSLAVGTDRLTTTDFYNGNIIVNDNFITTSTLNSDLILQANGTGIVKFDDALAVTDDFTVFGTTNFQNTQVNGTMAADLVAATNNVTASEYSTGDILINTNFITTTLLDSNLNLRADGTNAGVLLNQVLLFKGSVLSNNLVVGTESQRSINLVPSANQNVKINSTAALVLPIGTNANRILSSTGEVRFNSSNQRFEGRVAAGTKQLNGLYDLDQNTYISAELTPGANDNTILMFVNGSLETSITSQAASFNRLRVDELDFNNSTISTVNSNANIEFVQSGTGIINIKDNFTIQHNTFTNLNSGVETKIQSTGSGYVQFSGDKALVIPAGDSAHRPAGPLLGATRWSTTNSQLELWDGTVWTSAAGSGTGISAAEMEEIVDILTLVLG
jgi:hypothetical protein